MKTAQQIINDARFELATVIVTLMRKLDAYLATGKKNLMTAPEESVVIDFAELGYVPEIRVKVNYPYLDVEDVCHEIRPLDFIATGDDYDFYVSADGADIDADDISTDGLLAIAEVLEDAYADAEEK